MLTTQRPQPQHAVIIVGGDRGSSTQGQDTNRSTDRKTRNPLRVIPRVEEEAMAPETAEAEHLSASIERLKRLASRGAAEEQDAKRATSAATA